MNPEPKNENELQTAVAPSPPWIELPSDVTANILQRLEMVDILESAEKVCTTWRKICSDPSIWRVLHLNHFTHPDIQTRYILILWLRAVDRSRGQLEDLSIKYFGDFDYLLNYIVDRSTALKRLTLEYCYGITGKAVIEAVNKLPHLEELHLIDSPKITASDIVDIGNACPLLKSFTFTQRNEYSNRNECAVAIAKHMPNLYHLCLNSYPITNEGLEAILDGCPNLDSLDLLSCPNLDLRGALGKRCSEQIKHLKTPFDLNAFMSTIYKITLQKVDLTDFLAALDLIESDEEYSL